MATVTTRGKNAVLETNEIRIEGRDKVSGKTQYTADIRKPNMLWAAFATSPYAYAKVISIDTTAAKALPGVRAVLTAADIGKRYVGRNIMDWPVFAYDVVRLIGDRVAGVAADTREIAEEAVRLIQAMWSEKRTTFHGKYFHAENAILEPKPARRPPIMIAGGGEQLTLRVVARLADACNVFGDPAEVKRKFDILRQHCDTEGGRYDAIEKTNILSLLLARDDAALAAKRVRLGASDPFRGFAGTVAQVADLIGRYADSGVQLCISSAFKNDAETLELLASDVIPHF